MEHCIGQVINLKRPPEAKEITIDIPAYTQYPIDDEVLVNIEQEFFCSSTSDNVNCHNVFRYSSAAMLKRRYFIL